jgi:hypothetical protein
MPHPMARQKPQDAPAGPVPHDHPRLETLTGAHAPQAAGHFRRSGPVPYDRGMRSLWSPMLAVAMAIVLAITVTTHHGRRHHYMAPPVVVDAR